MEPLRLAGVADRQGRLSSGASAGSAADVARGFIRAHRDLFRLSAADVDGLDLVNDSKLVRSDGHAVLFRQRFGSSARATTG